MAATRVTDIGAPALGTTPRARRPRFTRVFGPDWKMGFLFILPVVVLVLALVAYPFTYAVYLSMTRKFVGVPPVFVGLENYVRLASDGFFPPSARLMLAICQMAAPTQSAVQVAYLRLLPALS